MALLRIPIAPVKGTFFDYQGTRITLSPVRNNPYLAINAWVMDISWLEEDVQKTIGGVNLVSGVDIIQQYTCPLPNLFVLSANNSKNDPVSTEDIRLYIKEI